MRVLIIKTSSMGDIIHTLPALTDAGNACPGIRFDWVVEEHFAEIPHWHPLVENVIPVAIRRWRKNLFTQQTGREILELKKTLSSVKYDLIIDAQGLFKTIWMTWLAKGPVSGLDRHSAREPLTALFYRHKYSASWKLHAITRLRHLFSQALSYTLPETPVDYGINRKQFMDQQSTQPYVVFLHGTTWASKHWPETHWSQLANLANENGFLVKLPWGNDEEYQRAERIRARSSSVEILPRLGLRGIATVLAGAKAIVAVDTGLGHLAAALNVPTVSLYGPTDPVLIGALGQSQIHLSATFPCAPCFGRECTYHGSEQFTIQPPCFSTVQPVRVWDAVRALLGATS